jgi:hypothetical protein
MTWSPDEEAEEQNQPINHGDIKQDVDRYARKGIEQI